MRKSLHLLLIVLMLLVVLPIVNAQDSGDLLAPPEITGEAVYIPFNVSITLDGDLSDWATIPAITVDRGSATSLDPAENGAFTFGVAADSENFYIYQTMLDKNIVAGQHATNFWNEDSLEFYLNLSGNLEATGYGDGIYQFNINAADIGNTDPSAITVTGVGSSAKPVQAFVFKTDDGWGYEAAVQISDFVTPTHGLEIGFQVQANGATQLDRDVKLIWSLADTGDNSWQNPSLFGRGLFFEIGSTDIPQPTPRAAPVEEVVVQMISLNQVGYFPNAPKIAVFADAGAGSSRKAWTILNADTNETVEAGITGAPFDDDASGDTVYVLDFSSLTTPGNYRLQVDGIVSPTFTISNSIYSQLKTDALMYFYLNRAGIELTPEYAGEWARPAGHVSDSNVTCYQGTDVEGNTWDGCDYTVDGGHGWYDAGDYGKYVVNSGISVWTLTNLYERFPTMFGDGSLNIPENGNGIPDILDEIRWNMDFMLAMQVPEGQPLAGMAHHKLHDLQWSGVPTMPPTEFNNNDPVTGRYVYPPSTAATLNLAASAAQCARVWQEYDADFSARCLAAAERAWVAANENPSMIAGRTPGAGGGDYPDNIVSDEFFWAAAELYITTGNDVYLDELRDSVHFAVFDGLLNSNPSSMTWGNTSALGTISLAMVPNNLPEDDIAKLRTQIISTADRYLETINNEGYRVPIVAPSGYVWGSNSVVLNNALIMALAHDFTGDVKYLNGVTETMDYILGRNALTRSFVSGYGTVTMEHPHHRFWGNQPANGFPAPPPGALAGGPNAVPTDETALGAGVLESGVSKRYVDLIGSWSTNEVTINWNAPLAWVAAYLDGVINQ